MSSVLGRIGMALGIMRFIVASLRANLTNLVAHVPGKFNLIIRPKLVIVSNV
jgi:hypothetical protein